METRQIYKHPSKKDTNIFELEESELFLIAFLLERETNKLKSKGFNNSISENLSNKVQDFLKLNF